MTSPLIVVKVRDPEWVASVMQPGPNGTRFDQAPRLAEALSLPDGVISMYDSVNSWALPSGAPAYAAYADGTFANVGAVRSRFPIAQLVTIAVTASGKAMYLDIEPGDAVPSQAAEFIKAGGIGFYCSASAMQACLDNCHASGLARSQFRVWSAHWIGRHICGPATCGYPQADGTQYVSTTGWDESAVMSPEFFAIDVAPPPPPPPPPLPDWQMAIIASLPRLVKGSTAAPWVRQAQLLCNIAGPVACKPDGIFGPQTYSSVEGVQRVHGLAVNGVVGPVTWQVLVAQQTGEALPMLRVGSQDALMIRRVQALCDVHGFTIKQDGSFGPVTKTAVERVQAQYLPYNQRDGIVGPVTWCCLIAHRHP